MSSISSNLALLPSAAQSSCSKTNALTPAQQRQVDQLKKRDADVRRHEAAHLAVAGGYARGGASFTYQTGPDGRQYAVGGEVQIDTSSVPHDPRATIAKLRTVEAAALAPEDPSSQDRSVAAAAATKVAQAQSELSQQQTAQNHQSNNQKGGLVDTFG
jgi:hypothetical protein